MLFVLTMPTLNKAYLLFIYLFIYYYLMCANAKTNIYILEDKVNVKF